MGEIDPAFVLAQRARRVPWSAIARQVGRCELDVRAGFEPGFVVPFERRKPFVRSATCGKVAGPKTPQRLPAITAARVLALLIAADGQYLTADQIGGQSGQNRISQLRKQYGNGIIATRRRRGYRITEAGKKVDLRYSSTGVIISVSDPHTRYPQIREPWDHATPINGVAPL